MPCGSDAERTGAVGPHPADGRLGDDGSGPGSGSGSGSGSVGFRAMVGWNEWMVGLTVFFGAEFTTPLPSLAMVLVDFLVVRARGTG